MYLPSPQPATTLRPALPPLTGHVPQGCRRDGGAQVQDAGALDGPEPAAQEAGPLQRPDARGAVQADAA